MKLAVISDIHGNLPALLATVEHVDRWGPDQVIVNGDVVNRGPRPRACWELVALRMQTAGWRVVRGNHEEYVTAWGDGASPGVDIRAQIFQSSYWTYQQLADHVEVIAGLPDRDSVQPPEGGVVRVTHGSMRGNTDGITMETPNEVLAEQIAPAPAVFCTAHTHRPLLRMLNGTLVVNSGAAGTTFDGDPRISYAQLVYSEAGWEAKIVRLPYDRHATRRDFANSGFVEGGGPLVDIFLQEWQLARPLINLWAAKYEESVLKEQVTLRQSVDLFLDDVL